MSLRSRFRSVARTCFRRAQMEQDLDEELHAYVDMATDERQSSGGDRSEAQRAVLAEMGGVAVVKERVRETWAGAQLGAFVRDVRYGIRSLRRSPGFTTAALLTLALTIGAVSTVLTLTNAIVVRPLPAPHPEEVVVVAAVRRNPSRPSWERVSYSDYTYIRDHATTVQDLIVHGSGGVMWVGYDGIEKRMDGAVVSAGFFSFLGVKPALGRFFTPDEDRVPGRDRVAVLSYNLWSEGWRASPDALGTIVKVGGVPLTVIGVAPKGFYGVDALPSELYVPMMMLGAIRGGCDFIANSDCGGDLQILGRLREGRSLSEAQAEASTFVPPNWLAAGTTTEVSRTLTVFHPRGAWGTYGEFGFEDWREGRPLAFLAGLCLLIGCANLAGLLLARGVSRSRELAIRASLGATTGRLLRQLMTESIVLALVGGLLGIVLSLGLTPLLFHISYERAPTGRITHFDLHPDPAVIVAVIAMALLAALLFGMLPALKTIGLGTAFPLNRQASSSVSHVRTARWLVGAQISIAVMLVVLAALLGCSARRLVADGHFDPSHVALFRLEFNWNDDSDAAHHFLRAGLETLTTSPDVLAASVYDRGTGDAEVTLSRARGATAVGGGVRGFWRAIDPNYFAVMRVPLAGGRTFDAHDTKDTPAVAIVDESLAHRLWPDGSAIGSTLLVDDRYPAEVVGIVADAYAHVRDEPGVPHVYVPFWQASTGHPYFCMRVRGDPASALPTLMRAVSQVDPGVHLSEGTTMMDWLANGDLKQTRMATAISVYSAGLAVLLAGVGIYGTLSFSVVRRTKEIGIRIAVGAAPSDVVAQIVGEEMKVVAAGIGAGLALAWGASRLVRHLLYGAASEDLLLYAGAILLVLSVGLLACWLPARSAAHRNPIAALNTD